MLRAAGHAVYTPTLTGLGERAHLGTAQTDLDTHIQDVVGVLECEELTGVILVGHSYAGMVIPGVADRVPGRLAHLVHFDGYTPVSGQSVLDIFTGVRAARAAAEAKSAAWRIPPPDPAVWGITEAEDLRRLRAHLVGHPLGTCVQPLRLVQPVGAGVPRTYIYCAGKAAPDSFDAAAALLRDDPTWRYRALPTGHEAMITMPRELADLLLEVAALP